MKICSSIIFSFIFVVLILIYMLFVTSINFEVCLIPIAICGVISLFNLLILLKDHEFLRNVRFYTWAVFFLSAFISPLIHIFNKYWIKYIYIEPDDWHQYAFLLSMIYFYGIMVLSIVDSFPVKKKIYRNKWKFKKNALSVIILCLLVSFAAQTIFYVKVGGLFNYMKSFTYKNEIINPLKGQGIYFIVSELFPYLYILYFYIKNYCRKTSGFKVFLFLFFLMLSCLYFGGLRGSRSNTIYVMLHAFVLIHFTIYRFKNTHFFTIGLLFVCFMTIGKIYKDHGISMFEDSRIERIDSELSPVEEIIVNDLTRYGIMSYELFMFQENKFYQNKYGETYLYGTLIFVPFGRVIQKSLNIKGRTSAASELQYDFDGYQRSTFRQNSRIFGFIGEAMLNFGIYSFFLSFIILFLILRLIIFYIDGIKNDDIRMYIIAFIPMFIILLINSDFNNVLLTLVKRILPMFFVLRIVSFNSLNKITT